MIYIYIHITLYGVYSNMVRNDVSIYVGCENRTWLVTFVRTSGMIPVKPILLQNRWWILVAHPTHPLVVAAWSPKKYQTAVSGILSHSQSQA